MASLSRFYSFRKRQSSGSDGPLDEKSAVADTSQDNKSVSSGGGKGTAEVEESEATSPGALSLEEGAALVASLAMLMLIMSVDAAGGLGRHLGVFSCTMLMCVHQQ